LLLTAREQQRDKSREQLDKMMQELTLDETNIEKPENLPADYADKR